MFCTKDNHKNCTTGGKCGAFAVGLLIGAAASATFCIVKKVKKKKCMSKLKKSFCDCADSGLKNFCDCDENASDYERERNGCGNLSEAEEFDTDILHSHGCLGYPHDSCGGFADSNGDRPNDLSNPEIDNQKGVPEGNTSPYQAKNEHGKSNPQPENKVNEVKK